MVHVDPKKVITTTKITYYIGYFLHFKSVISLM